MSKYCKKHPANKYDGNCVNCVYGDYISEVVNSGKGYILKPNVFRRHKASLKTKLLGTTS